MYRQHLRLWRAALPALVCALLSLAPGCAADLGGDGTGVGSGSDPLLRGRYTFERPEVGSIRMGGGCTATLFGSAQTAITAAHCVDYGTSRTPGNYGDFTLEPRPGERYRFTIRQFASLGGRGQTGRFDVAILQLDRPVPASVASPAPPVAARPADGAPMTIYGYGCQDRFSGSGSFAKQAFSHPFGVTTRNLCPGDSGGPTLSAAGEVVLINSAYLVHGGQDIFGVVLAVIEPLHRHVNAWRGSSPLVWSGDGAEDPPPPLDPPEDPPPPVDPPEDPPPPVGSCGEHSDCIACASDSRCGWCDGGCTGLHLDAAGRIQGNGCRTPAVLGTYRCPPPSAEPTPPPPPPSSGCGPWEGIAHYTCRQGARQFVRCVTGEPEFLTCPSGYTCRPGSRELMCYR